MLTVGLIITFLLGLSIVNALARDLSLFEKFGLSFIIGIFVTTVAMLVLDLIGIPLTASAIIATQLMITAIAGFSFFRNFNKSIERIKSRDYKLPKFNMIWMVFIAFTIYIEYMNFAKCMYFPTFDRDSLAGFETMGYITAMEHTYKNLSIFDGDYIPAINGAGSYITYAPMVQLSYAYVYLLGAQTSKIIPALMFMFFLISFYGVTRRMAGDTLAAIATFFVSITPEMTAFSSMSITNVIHAVYASLGIMYIAVWWSKKNIYDLITGALLLGANMWTRTDGIVFIGAAFVIVLVNLIKTKQMKPLFWFLGLTVAPALFWVIFQKATGIFAESITITTPYYDKVKMMKIIYYVMDLFTNTQFYGWTFVAFAIAFIANIWFIIKRGDNLAVLAMMVMAYVAYMIMLYQIDYKWDTIENVLMYSAKRFMFCFAPIVWYYCSTNRVFVTAFEKVDSFLSIKLQKETK